MLQRVTVSSSVNHVECKQKISCFNIRRCRLLTNYSVLHIRFTTVTKLGDIKFYSGRSLIFATRGISDQKWHWYLIPRPWFLLVFNGCIPSTLKHWISAISGGSLMEETRVKSISAAGWHHRGKLTSQDGSLTTVSCQYSIHESLTTVSCQYSIHESFVSQTVNVRGGDQG
jgi:hypothetical protein